MDNDFPKVIAKETSNPRSPYDIYKAPDWAKPQYPQQPEPKEDAPVKEAGTTGFLQQYVAGMNRYQQSGTDIPALNVQTDFARERGGPLLQQTLISKNPSFDLLPTEPDYTGPELPGAEEKMRQLFKTPAWQQRFKNVYDKTLRGA